jgi:hypothetical protein
MMIVLPLSIFILTTRGVADSGKSAWDANTLSANFNEVAINANSMEEAWRDITARYLLRANLYMDSVAVSNRAPFIFNQREHCTGKDIFDGFLAAYPDFTYTQNPDSGIIWFHPKRVSYGDILNQRIRIDNHGMNGVPMYTCVYLPLCNLIRPNLVDSSEAPVQRNSSTEPFPYDWLYDVDLPVGVHSAREILDFCCIANPTKAFLIRPLRWQQKPFYIFKENLVSGNPLYPPRVQAVNFWEVEIGKSTNGTPSMAEICKAMSDPDPKKRLAACLYVEACPLNYAAIGLVGKAADSDEAIWTALGEEYAVWRFSDTDYFTMLMRRIPRLRDDLKNVRNPCLALLASLQLTREMQETSYLDAIVNKHKYTEEEIKSIKPELMRMARSSKAVRDKLMEMKSQVPDLSPLALSELADTNSFLILPQESK